MKQTCEDERLLTNQELPIKIAVYDNGKLAL